LYQSAKENKYQAFTIKPDIQFLKNLLSTLPYQLTNYQKKALWEIVQDLSNTSPCNRLLEGDVGSGKTIVAFLSCLLAASQVFNQY
jgi:ATP-dependent DNA helicase RecG